MTMSDQTLSYKSYLGSIEVSTDDNCLFGKILFINDLVTYEANTVGELKIEFQKAVDGYLAFCDAEGVSPDKPFSGTFNVRIPPGIHREAALYAARCGVSLNEFVKDSMVEKLSESTGEL